MSKYLDATPPSSYKTSYDGADSLNTKMKAIKKAVGAQYGRDSAEHAAVKGIAL